MSKLWGIGDRTYRQTDTNVYGVMFPYLPLQQYAAKNISENMYPQVDAEGYQYKLMGEILDHRNNVHVFHCDYAFIIYRSGQKNWRCTIKGWFICVRWNYGSDLWVSLKDLKETNTVEVAEYTAAKKLCLHPIFQSGSITALWSEIA